MPFIDFDAARRAYERSTAVEPVTFALCGEIFTALREPMWGDILALWNAPDIEDDEARATLALTTFIRAMLDPDDRVRWDAAMFKLPQSQAGMTLLQIGAFIAEHMTGFPTTPPASSVVTPPLTGESSNESGGGSTTSSKRSRTSRSTSSTGTSPDTVTKISDGRSTGSSASSRSKK